MRCASCWILWLFVAAQISADEPLPRIPPKEPADALKTFVVREGFEMQLLAAEPLVASPVAIEYDENGRAFVAEMRDYPYTHKASDKPFVERTQDEPIGRIRLLEDIDGDGRFDKSTIFADGLSWPTGLALWQGGVYVVATPDLWYLKDTDGDGKADERRKVLTGFRKFNVQAVVNNLKWGLDGKLYGAGSSNGGQIRRGDSPDSKPVVMATADFRFDPRDEANSFELQSGGARFGNSFDDWGNRFICNIRNPIQHVVLPREWLARNPHWPARSALHDVAESGDTVPVFRISPPEPWRVLNSRRLASDATIASPRSETVAAGYMTSASGLTVYRGDAYPPELYGSVFQGEVSGNLIHHQLLTPRGVTFTAKRSSENSEFVASTDNWFRPVNFVNAPDGTLHVLDMYRETIEHPWSIPDDIKARLDLESGRDRGRIYRLAPAGFQPPKPLTLGQATTDELVRHLANTKSWWRDTAHRQLLERNDKAAVPLLREIVQRSEAPVARLHALHLLASFQSLEESDLLAGLRDSHGEVRRHAVMLAEPQLRSNDRLRERVLLLASDADDRVRFQVAFSVGTIARRADGAPDESVVKSLAKIARHAAGDEFIRTAVMTSAADVAPDVLLAFMTLNEQFRRQSGQPLLDTPNLDAERITRDLAFVIGARNKPAEVEQFFGVVEQFTKWSDTIRFTQAVTAGLGDGLKRANRPLAAVLSASKTPGATVLGKTLDDAAATIRDAHSKPDARQAAAPLLAFVEFAQAREVVAPLMQASQPAALQTLAVRTLAAHRQPDVSGLLLAAIRQLAPEARAEALDALLSRPEAHAAVLDAIDGGAIAVSDIPHVRRNLLVRSSNAAVKERAIAMFAAALASRQKAIEKYRSALPSLKADRAKGEAVYRRDCMSCHRAGEVGTEVGPNLRTIRHRAAEEVLLHVLDPNREVGPNFVAYAVATDDGRVSVGLLVEETGTSVTLLRPNGTRETILRANIEELAATGKSLMPEGLDEKVSPQEMADLLEFLLK